MTDSLSLRQPPASLAEYFESLQAHNLAPLPGVVDALLHGGGAKQAQNKAPALPSMVFSLMRETHHVALAVQEVSASRYPAAVLVTAHVKANPSPLRLALLPEHARTLAESLIQLAQEAEGDLDILLHNDASDTHNTAANNHAGSGVST